VELRRFLVDKTPEGLTDYRLTGDEARHALRVLRLKPGEEVVLIDGLGREFRARISAADRSGLDLAILEELPPLREPALGLTLGIGLLKGENMDLLVQKGTELGLTRLIPLNLTRSEVRLSPDRAARKVERWRKISVQSLKQCRRAKPLEILGVMDLNRFLDQTGPAELRIMLYEEKRGDRGKWKDLLDRPALGTAAVLIGPEGGFTREEVELASGRGFEVMGLGPRVLRSETAALALLAILGFELGDFS
jgi:16S rRNA (uracil1498-N3)-methyltransferase